MKFFHGRILFLSLIMALALHSVALAAADQLGSAIEAGGAMVRQGQESQQRIDAMDDETTRLAHEYRNIVRDLENMAVYNDNLEAMIRSQEAEADSLRRQVEDIKVTQREIVPLMLRMVDSLEAFVAVDMPFLTAERTARVEGLRNLLQRADVEVPEKYRQVMLAYQTEADYGRTIEAYQGELEADGHERSVEFLRIGRLVLAYQTLDRRESGYWDRRQAAWISLDAKHHQAIRQGLRIAARQAAPELVRIPVTVSPPVPPSPPVSASAASEVQP